MSRLPAVPQRLERGRRYRSEYSWQEDPSSDYHRLYAGSYVAFKAAGLTGRDDIQIDAPEALELIRPWRPDITSARQLFQETAWQPCKVLLSPRLQGACYTKWMLTMWARSTAHRLGRAA